MRKHAPSVVCVVIAALSFPSLAGADTINPNVLADEDSNNANCSLREAVTAANTDAAYNGCTAGSGADTITLQSGSTYALGGTGLNGVENANAQGDLDVSGGPLTIQASGASLATIDANGGTSLDRVLDVDPNNLGGVTSIGVVKLALTDGNDSAGAGGAAIRHGSFAGALSISGSRLFGNSSPAGGGAVLRLDGSSTAITDTSIDSNTGGSGAIFQEFGSLTITGSTISGQAATGATNQGGAIVKTNSTTATLTNTTISGNSSKANGGAIFQLNGTLNLRNATIAGNTADSDAGGTAGDGGGIFASGGTVNVRNSIIADNVDASGATAPDCSGSITSGGHNLVESTSGCTGVTGTGDITGTDPALGALAANGGPTQTQALLTVLNPALNTGDPGIPGSGGTACESIDQRGLARTPSSTGTCDIGAYERQPPALGALGNKTVQAGQALSFNLSATDPDPADTVSFLGSNLPSGATVSPSGAFSWTPGAAQLGSFPNVQLTASDGTFVDNEAITITVTAPPGGGGPPATQPPGKKKCKKAKKRAAATTKKCKKKKK